MKPAKKPSEIIHAARYVIADESAWTKGTPVRDAEGEGLLSPFDKTACQFCAWGALMVAAGEDHYHAYVFHPVMDQMEQRSALISAVGTLVEVCRGNIGRTNDRSTHTQILKLFDKAFNLAKQKEA